MFVIEYAAAGGLLPVVSGSRRSVTGGVDRVNEGQCSGGVGVTVPGESLTVIMTRMPRPRGRTARLWHRSARQ